jgi:hypothetical protein
VESLVQIAYSNSQNSSKPLQHYHQVTLRSITLVLDSRSNLVYSIVTKVKQLENLTYFAPDVFVTEYLDIAISRFGKDLFYILDIILQWLDL